MKMLYCTSKSTKHKHVGSKNNSRVVIARGRRSSFGNSSAKNIIIQLHELTENNRDSCNGFPKTTWYHSIFLYSQIQIICKPLNRADFSNLYFKAKQSICISMVPGSLTVTSSKNTFKRGYINQPFLLNII